MATTNESNSTNSLGKEFFTKTLGQLGVGAVLAVLLLLYYQSESRRWDERQAADEKRWEQLFNQYRADAQDARQTIEACCHDRLLKLEEIEAQRRGRTRP